MIPFVPNSHHQDYYIHFSRENPYIGWWFQMIFYVHPYLGKMNPFWLIFFQMGLVHRQLGILGWNLGPKISCWTSEANFEVNVNFQLRTNSDQVGLFRVVPVIPLKWKGSAQKNYEWRLQNFHFGASIWEWYVKGRATEQLKRKTQKPRHPKTPWEGIWTPKTYLKHLLRRYLDVKGQKNVSQQKFRFGEVWWFALSRF